MKTDTSTLKKITGIYMPLNLRQWAEKKADSEGRSLSNFLVNVIAERKKESGE